MARSYIISGEDARCAYTPSPIFATVFLLPSPLLVGAPLIPPL